MILLGPERATASGGLDHSLRLSEARFEALAAASADSTWIAHNRFQTDPAARSGGDATGQTQEQWLGPRRFEEIHPEDRAAYRAAWAAALADHRPLRLECRRRENHGAYRWTTLLAIPVITPDGTVEEWIVTSTDNTTQRQAIYELERRRDEAIAASQSKDRFLAVLSHELRTPLTPVLLLASDAAGNPDLPDAVREDFNTIRDNIAVLTRLIDDLLDITRIAHGKLHLALQRCDPHNVVQEAIAVVQGECGQKHIALTLEPPTQAALVSADPVRLQQAYWNVLRNAVHFTPPGGTIVVRAETDRLHGQFVVRVTDSGAGISPNDLDRIFVAFTQAQPAPGTPRRAGGLGLGLAIAREIIGRHSGSIQASSPGLGRGATFTLSIPLAAPSPRPPASTGTGSDLPAPVVAGAPGAPDRVWRTGSSAPQ